MKSALTICTFALIGIVGCNGNPFSKFEHKPAPGMEKIVYDTLEAYADNATQCREQKLTLVRGHQLVVKDLVTQIKDLATKETPKVINIKALQTYAKSSSDKPDKLVFEIVTGQRFKKALIEAAQLMRELANNREFTHSLTAIRNDLNQESGDRLAELLTMDSLKQHVLLHGLRALSCQKPSELDFSSLLMTPQILGWLAGPNAVFLVLRSELIPHTAALAKALKEVTPPEELWKFFEFLHTMAPHQDVCSMENLDAYEKPLTLIEHFLKTPEDPKEHRPLRKFLNLLFRLRSMENSNHCIGKSFDKLEGEDIQRAFLQTADFLTDEHSGLIWFLQKMKPRD